MAILGEIRKRPFILVGFIAIGLLAFLINPKSLDKFFGKNPNILGKVNGDEITRDEYNSQLEIAKNQAQSQGLPTTGLEDQVWNTIVQQKLIKQQFEKMGMKMTDDLFWSQIQYDPMFAQNPQLFDAKGNFKVNEVKKLVESLKTSGKPEAYNNWLNVRKEIEYRIMARLFFENINNGIIANKKEIEQISKYRNQIAHFDYVKIDYNNFTKNNPIKVTNQDLTNFIKKYPVTFHREEGRSIGLVYFPASPSAEDENIALTSINKLYKEDKENFSNTPNDSTFVEIHSDSPIKYGFVSEQDLPTEGREQIKNSAIGSFVGPYKSGTKFYITKVLGKNEATLPKHILISFKESELGKKNPGITRNKEEAKKLADDIYAKIKAQPESFNNYVTQSDDPGSAQQGGALGWVLPGQSGFVKPFAQWVESNPKGAVGIVESPFGYHIIVNENKMPVYKIANLAKEIQPSKQTENKIYTQANTFIQNIQGKNFNEFANIAKKNNYNFINTQQVSRFQGTINGLGTDKDEDVLNWAFNKDTKVGNSNIFATNNGGYIISFLVNKTDEGLADASSVREQIERIVRKEIIAKKISEKINALKATSLEQIAQIFGTTKATSEINFLNPVMSENSIEPKVAGAVFGIKNNVLSKPIEGNSGVFIIMKKDIAENNQIGGDNKQIGEAIKNQNSQFFIQSILKSLRYSAEIKDYRIELLNKASSAE